MNISAKVVKGVQIGAKFGIATANLELAELPAIEEGVYLVDVKVKAESYTGLLHFGPRKTFGGDFSAEVHILDFETDIYGETLGLELGPKLRDVKAFQNSDALFTQIETDIVMARKYFLRRDVRARWAGLSLNDQQQLSSTALKHLSASAAFLEAQTVFAYAPMLGKEIGFVAGLMAAFPSKQYAFPKVAKSKMEFYAVDAYSSLKLGAFDILEPATGEIVMPSQTDLMLVPSVALTRAGERLGQGGGFYDRYLESHKVKTLGVVPSFAVVEKIPTQKHDQKLEGVIVCEL